MAGYTSDLYVNLGFTELDYVSDLYVQDGYVTGVIEADASISGAFSLVSNPLRVLPGDSTISTNTTLVADGNTVKNASATANATATLGNLQRRIAGGESNIGSALSFAVTASALVNPSADLNSNATLTSIPLRSLFGESTLKTNIGSTPWQDMNTWNNPAQSYWNGFTADGQIVKTAEANLSIQATVTANAFAVLAGSVIKLSLGTMQVDGTILRNGDTSISSQFTSTADGQLIVEGTTDLSSNFALAANGEITIQGEADISGVFNATLIARTIAAGEVLKASSGTLEADAGTIRNASSSMQSQFSCNAAGITPGQSEMLANFTATADGEIIISGTADLEGEFAVSATASANIQGVVSMTAFNTVLSTAKLFVLDPKRIYTVDSESRLLVIDAETRKYAVKSENRVNTVEQETRSFAIPSETRNLVVEHTTLVDAAGIRDTREG